MIKITYENGKTITVMREEYVKPQKSCSLGFLVPTLDNMDVNYGLSEHKYYYKKSDWTFSPKLLVTDESYNIIEKNGYEIVINRILKHNVFKEALFAESVDFIADVARYCQWCGIVNSLLTDVMFSLYNAISSYVYDNWSGENRTKFACAID